MKIAISIIIFLTFFLFGLSVAQARFTGKSVDYKAVGDPAPLKGYLSYDTAIEEKSPGVIVVPEWWGVNDYTLMRARMLAKLGYVTLVADIYGNGQIATDPTEAIKYSSQAMKDFETTKARFQAAYNFLKRQPNVDASRIAAIGYCFGGGVVLNMARQGADLKGAVSFHGGLSAVKPTQKGEVNAKILVLNGEADKFVSTQQIQEFKKEMTDAGADFQVINYPEAPHSFTNPASTELGKKYNLPIAYNNKADKASWRDVKKFLHDIFLITK